MLVPHRRSGTDGGWGRGNTTIVQFLGSFTRIERAITLLGLSPVALIGAGVHGSAVPANLPPPSYQSFLPVPDATPRRPAPVGGGPACRPQP